MFLTWTFNNNLITDTSDHRLHHQSSLIVQVIQDLEHFLLTNNIRFWLIFRGGREEKDGELGGQVCLHYQGRESIITQHKYLLSV